MRNPIDRYSEYKSGIWNKIQNENTQQAAPQSSGAMNNVLLCVCARLSFYEMFSEGPNGEDDVRPPLWDDVALLPEQAQQQVLGVPGPVVDPGALEPGGNVSLQTQMDRHQRF